MYVTSILPHEWRERGKGTTAAGRSLLATARARRRAEKEESKTSKKRNRQKEGKGKGKKEARVGCRRAGACRFSLLI
jgi:hypothetical protein